MKNRPDPITEKLCVGGCGTIIRSKQRGGAQKCEACRSKTVAHVEECMTASEVEAHFEAVVEFERMPRYMHSSRHVFPKGDTSRCLKCGCKKAPADLTICAEKMSPYAGQEQDEIRAARESLPPASRSNPKKGARRRLAARNRSDDR